MRVLQISYYGYAGGAGGAVAMRRLHFGLRNAGIDSKVLCALGANQSFDIMAFNRSKALKKLDSLLRRATFRFGLNNILDVSSFRVRKHRSYLEADIVHFHRIYDFFSYLAIPSLTERKVGILTLHDMWYFTGHCYHSLDCDRFKIGCGKCPYPKIFPPIKKDSTRIEWRFKNRAYSRSNLTIVSPSSWMTEQAKQSMLNRFQIYHIPPGVDTESYKPLDRKQCRSLLGIPQDKKVLLFIAASLKNKIKGVDLLVKALQSLPKSLKAETILLLVGKGGEHIATFDDIQTLDLGYISSDRFKAIAYSAADLFIHPTRAEVAPLVLIESMACGTPIVSFRIGGVPDAVRPGITGYLAEPQNVESLRNRIVELLEDSSQRNYMSQQCRAIALREYSFDLHMQRHINLYRGLLQN